VSAAGPAGKQPDFNSLGFVGLAALGLAVASLFSRRFAPILFGSIVWLFSLWMVRGGELLFALLRKVLPYFSTFHAPEGYFLLCFAVATLAAFGLTEVSRRIRARGSSKKPVAAIVVALTIIEASLLLDFTGVIRLRDLSENLQKGHFVDYLLVVILLVATSAVFWVGPLLRKTGRDWSLTSFWPALGGLLVVTVALKLVAFIWITNPMQPARLEWLYPETPLVAKLKTLQKERRILPLRQHLPSNLWTPPVLFSTVPAVFGLRSGSGYESLLPSYVANLWRTVENAGAPKDDVLTMGYRFNLNHDQVPIKLLERLSVGLFVTAPGVRPLDPAGRNLVQDGTLRLVYQGRDGWIFEDARALPRAFMAPREVTVC
jgi:hypothetical protein